MVTKIPSAQAQSIDLSPSLMPPQQATAATATPTAAASPVAGGAAAAVKKQTDLPSGFKFLASGVAGCMATCVVQPIDLLKTRMQLSGEGGGVKYKNSLDALVQTWRAEGMRRMYTGLSAALFRQATYTTTRLGLYNTLEAWATKDGKPPGYFTKFGIACLAGATGAFIGTPAEVALIRMTADGRRPVHLRRNYAHVFNALSRITREEGVLALWKGCMPTVARAVVLNATQLSTYSQSKQLLAEKFPKQLPANSATTHFVASTIAAVVCTLASLPVDTIKTRVQQADPGQYKNGFDVLRQMVKNDGVLSLWRGYPLFFVRIAPHTVLTFMFVEQIMRLTKLAMSSS